MTRTHDLQEAPAGMTTILGVLLLSALGLGIAAAVKRSRALAFGAIGVAAVFAAGVVLLGAALRTM